MNNRFKVALLAMLAVSQAFGQNLLVNGDFTEVDPLDSRHALGWTHWSWNTGWSERQILGPTQLDPTAGSHGGNDNTGNYDFSPQITVGVIGGEHYAGVLQDNILAEEGKLYRFSFDSGAEAWWLPWGEFNLVFLGAADAEISRTTFRTCDPLNNATNGGLGDKYDKGIPYQPFSFHALAPAGTVEIKAELVVGGQGGGFGTWGGGNVWMDNAVLEQVLPVSGSVDLGDWAGTLEGTPVTFDLWQNGSLVETVVGKLNAYGGYEIVTAVKGEATIVAKASHWLAKAVVATPGTAGVDFALINGDIDGDNAVTVFDYAALSDAFDSSEGSANWNKEADLDGDLAVTVFDYAILSNNFDLSGD